MTVQIMIGDLNPSNLACDNDVHFQLLIIALAMWVLRCTRYMVLYYVIQSLLVWLMIMSICMFSFLRVRENITT